MQRNSLLLALGGACLMLLALNGPDAKAQVINVDEFGSPDPGNLQLGVQTAINVADPTVPGGPPTVGYFLPFPTVPGDVVVFEPPLGAAGPASDLLRFVQGPTGTLLLVYSDVSTADPGSAHADVGLPSSLQTNVFRDFETGLNGQPYTDSSNGLFYQPTGNQPGAIPTGAPIHYNFVSDSAPEPGMLCFATCAAGLLLRKRR